MRILLITRNFPPLQGGMERLIQHVAQSLSAEFDVVLCGPIGAKSFFPSGFFVREVPHRPLWRFLLASFWGSSALAFRYRPEAIIGGSGLTGPAARILASLLDCPAIVYLHGLDIVAAHPIYRLLFLPMIRRCDVILVNSMSTRQLAIDAGVPAERLTILHPGTSLPELPSATSRTEARHAFRERFRLNTDLILLSVGRMTQRKGLCEFIKNSLPDIVRNFPECVFVIIGDSPKNALLADGFSQRECAERASIELGLTKNIRFLGEVDDETLNLSYQSASALIFPVIERPGDIEGFGMVAIEAAAHGTPTLAFAVGGVPEAISNGVSGQLLVPGDYAGMTDSVLDIFNGRRSFPDCRTFAEKFAWPSFEKRLLEILGKTVG